jgi:AcrR family transcriptional regulator
MEAMMAKRPASKSATSRAKTATRTAKAGTARASRKTQSAKAASAPHDAGHLLHQALLAQLATIGWRDLSFADIVAAAGLSMADAYRIYQSKLGILRGLALATDQAVLQSLTDDPLDGSPRDRLFDLIMRRLDQYADHKAALSNLLHDLQRHPAEAACLAARLERSMSLTLDLAGLSASGLRGILRTKGLTALYLLVLRRWLTDDSADSAATMALLDKRLDQAERIMGFIGRGRHRPSGAAGQSSTH